MWYVPLSLRLRVSQEKQTRPTPLNQTRRQQQTNTTGATREDNQSTTTHTQTARQSHDRVPGSPNKAHTIRPSETSKHTLSDRGRYKSLARLANKPRPPKKNHLRETAQPMPPIWETPTLEHEFKEDGQIADDFTRQTERAHARTTRND